MKKAIQLLTALVVSGASLAWAGKSQLPNIIIIYTDDVGYGDLSCYNPKAAYQTPRLDRMAAEGIRFTDAHSPSTICSPSRYGLFSGQQIYRSTGRGGGAFEGPGGPSYLKPGTLTLGGMLQQQGYQTGVFGKWHVGLTWLSKDGKQLRGGFESALLIDYDKSTPLVDGPNQRGFNESFITPNCPTTDPLYLYIENGMVPSPADRRHHSKDLPNPGGKWRWDNDEGWMAPGYEFMKADLLFYEKLQTFITKHRKNRPEQPFFAVLATQIAHAPVLPAPEFEGKSTAGPRGDFLLELDALTGRVLDLIAGLGIDEETLVLFNSDNGPETMHVAWMRDDHRHDPAGAWRGMKRDGWEGGHRVPFIARWPGRIPNGQVSGQMTNTTDIFATLASIGGYKLPDAAAVDSFDMLPAMIGTQDPKQSIRPHLLTQSFAGEFQLRQGDWKYLDHKGSGGNQYKGILEKYILPETEPEAPGQLYNLATDPGETTNLYFKEAAKRQQLQALLKNLKTSGRSAPQGRVPVGIDRIPQLNAPAAALPPPNPRFPPHPGGDGRSGPGVGRPNGLQVP
jgi:arylsulfatase A-like enzyme